MLCIESDTGASWGWVDLIRLEHIQSAAAGQPEPAAGQSGLVWEAENYYEKQKENPAADLQPGGEIRFPVSDNGAFVDGSYYILVSSCGNRRALDVKRNDVLLGSITRNETNFSMSSMTVDALLRPVYLRAGDVVSICCPGESGSSEGPWGWVDKMTLIPAKAPDPQAEEEYRYPAQAYGKASMFLPAADLQPGQSLEIPLSDQPHFMEGTYKLMVVSNGTREVFHISVNHSPSGSILRRPSDYGDNGMSFDELDGALYLKPSDVVTITGQDGDFYGWGKRPDPGAGGIGG